MRAGSLMHRVKDGGRQLAIGTGFSVFVFEGVRYVEMENPRLRTWQIAELPERYGLNPFDAARDFAREQRAVGWPWITPDEPEPPEPEPYITQPELPRAETPKEARRRLRTERQSRPKPAPGGGHPPLFESF